jgi:hypothetical protein
VASPSKFSPRFSPVFSPALSRSLGGKGKN